MGGFLSALNELFLVEAVNAVRVVAVDCVQNCKGAIDTVVKFGPYKALGDGGIFLVDAVIFKLVGHKQIVDATGFITGFHGSTPLLVVFFDFIGAIGVVVNPQIACLVVFAMACDDLAPKAVHDFLTTVAVVAVAFNPVILVDIKLHGDCPLTGRFVEPVCVVRAVSVLRRDSHHHAA